MRNADFMLEKEVCQDKSYGQNEDLLADLMFIHPFKFQPAFDLEALAFSVSIRLNDF